MKKVILSLSFIGMAFLASCGGSAETVEANDAQEVATASENAQAYAINADESSISWRGFKIFQDPTKPETGHHGFIKFKSGELTFNEGVLEAGSFIADLTTLESVDLNDDPDSKADLDGHLKSEDFLFVESFPEAKFEISNVKYLEEGDFNTEISGNLDFRGVPKNITFKANVKEENGVVSFNSEEIMINRQDFGIDFQGGGDSIIKDEVALQVEVKANQA